MKKRRYRKAAGDYSGSSLGFADNNSVMAKHKAFAAGAQWRIESVWHEARKVPEMKKYLLVEDEHKGHFSIYKLVGQEWKDMVYDFNIFRWAYIEDLIPERMEETK